MTDQDRISLMFDSMVKAVDEGFSYDGIVSVPETGLEDIEYRPGLVGLFHDGLGLVRKAAKVFHKSDPNRLSPPSQDPEPQGEQNPRDSGISSPHLKVPELSSLSQEQASNVPTHSEGSLPQVQAGDESLQASLDDGKPIMIKDTHEIQPASADTSEKALSDEESQGKQPRKKYGDQESSPKASTEKQPRKKGEGSEHSPAMEKLPRKKQDGK